MAESAGKGEICPLCSTAMIRRKRDPLARILGFLLLYVVIFLALCLLPTLTLSGELALAALALYAFYVMRQGPTWWCPECWHEQRPADVRDLADPP